MAEQWTGKTLLGKYRIMGEPAEGAMGRVFRVRHMDWGVDLAMKQPLGRLLEEPRYRESFIRECEAWIGLGLHENTVSCYYVRNIDGVPSVFAEWMEGGTLRERMERGLFSAARGREAQLAIVAAAIQTAGGLCHAHSRRLIHQDVKPDNILFTGEGAAKVTDFGISGACGETPGRDGAPGEADGALLRCMAAPGTPAYCSPEQKYEKFVTVRTDMWSFAVTLLELLLGGRPWRDGQVAGLSAKLYLDSVGDFAPRELRELILSCFGAEGFPPPKDMREVENALRGIYRRLAGADYPAARSAAALSADAHSNRALSYLDLGRPELAEKEWQAALDRCPGHMPAVYNRAMTAWRGGETDDLEAMRRIQNAFNCAPSPASALLLTRFLQERRTTRPLLQLARRYALAPPADADPGLDACKLLTVKRARTFCADPGSALCVIAFEDRSLELWSAAGGRRVAVLEARGEAADDVAFCAASGAAAVACRDGALRLYGSRGEPGRCLRFAEGGVERVYLCAGGARGIVLLHRVERGGHRRYLMLIELENGAWQHKLRSEAFEGPGFCVLPDERRVAISRGGQMSIVDLESGRQRAFAVFDGSVSCAAAHPSGELIAVGGAAGELSLWSCAGDCVRRFLGHDRGVASMEFSRDGSLLLSAGADGRVRLWRTDSGRCLRSFTAQNAPVLKAGFCGDGSFLSAGLNSAVLLQRVPAFDVASELCLCKVSSLEAERRLSEEFASLLSMADAAYEKGGVKTALELLRRAGGLRGFGQNPEYLRRNALCGRGERAAGVRSAWALRSFEAGEAPLLAAVLALGGARVCALDRGSKLWMWDAESGERLPEAGQLPGARCLAALGDRLAVGCEDGRLRLVDMRGGQLRALPGHTQAVCALDCRGGTLVSASMDHSLCVRDAAGGAPGRSLRGHTLGVCACAVSGDGRLVLSAGWDNRLCLWESATGRRLLCVSLPGDAAGAAAISADGALGAAGGGDGGLCLYELRGGRLLWRRETPAAIKALRFSGDGGLLFVCAADGTVRCHESATGKLLRETAALRGGAVGMDITEDGLHILAVGERGAALLRVDYDYSGQ